MDNSSSDEQFLNRKNKKEDSDGDDGYSDADSLDSEAEARKREEEEQRIIREHQMAVAKRMSAMEKKKDGSATPFRSSKGFKSKMAQQIQKEEAPKK